MELKIVCIYLVISNIVFNLYRKFLTNYLYEEKEDPFGNINKILKTHKDKNLSKYDEKEILDNIEVFFENIKYVSYSYNVTTNFIHYN